MTNIQTIKDWDNINSKHKVLLLFIYSNDIKDNHFKLIENLSNKVNSKTKIFKLNTVDQTLVNELDVTSYPCIRLYKNKSLKKEFFIQEKLIDSVTFFLENHIYDNYC